MPSGTYTVQDLLNIQTISSQTAAAFGIDAVAEVLQADLDSHNRVVDEMTGLLAEPTIERQGVYGESVDAEMGRADEYDRGDTVKITGGSEVGYPLYKFQRGVGWTYDYMLQTTLGQIANTFLAIEAGHRRRVRRELLTAIFSPTNATVRDSLIAPNINLAVKRLVNADSLSIPNGLNGETFNAATHTHYDFIDSATPTNAGLIALINDVVEHGHGRRVTLNINRTAISAVKALTDFTPLPSPFLQYPNATVPTMTLEANQSTDNYMIGIFDGRTEVWVRSWVPAGYVFAFDAEGRKPLRYRQHPQASVRGLRIVARTADHPLFADMMDAYFGFGAHERTNGAVLYYAASASAYVAPTFS